jgi:hypothetical protein
MFGEDLHIIKPAQYGPYTTIQSAIVAAAASSPPSVVVITPDYTGTDTYSSTATVTVLDLRQGVLNTGNSISGVRSGVVAVAGAAAPITAVTGGTFVTTLNLPGASAFEQVPFTVKASGYVSLAAGTYTASVQPLLYASSLAGYTASAAAAIFSAAAVSITYAAAAATVAPFELEAYLVGDSTSHKLTGRSQATAYVAGATLVNALVAPAIITNPLTVFTASAAIPVQFLVGVTMVSANAASVINLGSFFIES